MIISELLLMFQHITSLLAGVTCDTRCQFDLISMEASPTRALSSLGFTPKREKHYLAACRVT